MSQIKVLIRRNLAYVKPWVEAAADDAAVEAAAAEAAETHFEVCECVSVSWSS